MDQLDETIVKKILTVDQPANGDLTIVKWYVNTATFKTGNICTSEICRITIEYARNDAKIEKKHVFVKIPANSPMYERGTKFEFYRKEASMYTQVLPRLATINGGERFWPACYHVGEKESLILEDLTPLGYRVANRRYRLDFEHCRHAFRCIAKFHGLSVRLARDDEIPQIVRNDFLYVDENGDDLDGMVDNGFAKFCGKLDSNIKEKYTKEIRAFRDLTKAEKIFEDMGHRGTSFNVLNHGDLWASNFVFKYDADGAIQDVKMVDFQQSRFTSPALDLVYLIMNSVPFEVFDKYFDSLLTTYLETLNETLRKFRCDEYTMEDLKGDIGKKYKYAVFLLMGFLPCLTPDTHEKERVENTDSVKGSEDENDRTLDLKLYVKFGTEWFLHFVEKDIFGFQLNGTNSSSAADSTNDKIL